MAKIIKIGMADLNVAKCPDILQTAGLGSCVGVCLWDSITKIGGLAHIMLPYSTQARSVGNEAKFADTAIPLLVKQMENLGALRQRLVAKIAGGAQMFSFYSGNDIMRIGERNAEAVKETLAKLKIKLLAEDVGGNYGRTIEFYTETGKLYIRTINVGEKII
ncbi:chemotaxis protein CheD [Thermincola potens]|uniref:Probable chemoreceptor glutamine deamidase CheD n=1 Tax=Thermincola potens (strain JR) TaxID=635013 RepID=D5XFE6_THEPJ|nr:chemotaxis protein CheD [Thermincola potens]ADG82367.1 CheD [Thermincola potens JR]